MRRTPRRAARFPRAWSLACLPLVLAALAVGLVVAPAAAAPEDSFVSKINSERSSRGLAPLEVYWDLVDDAEAHSKRMKSEDELFHNPNLGSVTSGWSALAENVGVGGDVDRLHEAFMDSDGHRKNILGDYNYVGVGVVTESDLKMWVTVVFMRGPDGLVSPPSTTTTTTPTTTTTRPPSTSTSTTPPSTEKVPVTTTTVPGSQVTPGVEEAPPVPPAPRRVIIGDPFAGFPGII
jgi:hypothetical protein